MDILKEKLPGLDFSDEIADNPELEKYIKEACESYELEFRDPLSDVEAPKLDEDFSSYFLLCGLPKVEEEKREKLLNVITKIFTKLNIDFISPDKITMLMDDSTGKSFGTAFIKCENDKQAKLASKAIHGFDMTKKNKIMSSTFDEFERLVKIPDEYDEPRFADLLDLYSYSMDQANDQFMVRENNQITIKMNKIPTKADTTSGSKEFHDVLISPEKDNSIRTMKDANWSPQGRYLIVLQENIVQLYGGSNFDLVREIIHTGVSYAKVSPCERYIITYSSTADEKEGNYNFWKINTGDQLRYFTFDEYTTQESGPEVFSFSYDGNYCAKLIKDHVVVYELPDMSMLMDQDLGTRVGIRIDRIKSFHWNPSKSMFSYWRTEEEEKKNLPPKIGFIEIPSRKMLNEREISNGIDLKLQWSADGSKLISMNKLKMKKAFYNNIAIFDLNSQSIPVVIISTDFNILDSQWITSTKRFMLLIDRSKKIQDKWPEKSALAVACLYDISEENGSLHAKFIGNTKEHISNRVEWAKNGNIFI